MIKEITFVVKNKTHAFCFSTEDFPLEGPTLSGVYGEGEIGCLSVAASEEEAWALAENWFYATHPYWVGKEKKEEKNTFDYILKSFTPPEDEGS